MIICTFAKKKGMGAKLIVIHVYCTFTTFTKRSGGTKPVVWGGAKSIVIYDHIYLCKKGGAKPIVGGGAKAKLYMIIYTCAKRGVSL